MTTTQQAPVESCSIEALVATRNATVQAAVDIATVICEAPDSFPELAIETRSSDRFSVEKVAEIADRRAWSTLIMDSGLWTFMDSIARREWTDNLEQCKFPTFTEECAEDTIRSLHEQRPAMVGRGIAEVFRRLSPDHKTNRPEKFVKRLILTGIGSVWGGKNGFWSLNHRACDMLDDLCRFMAIMRGIPETDHRHAAYRDLTEQTGGQKDWPKTGRLPGLSFKLFKNGNGHMCFDDQDDVDRLNLGLAAQSGGLALPGWKRTR